MAFLLADRIVPVPAHLLWPDLASFVACIRGVETLEQAGADVRVVAEQGADLDEIAARLASLRHLRADVCCEAEPECPLCPLRPVNARTTIVELEAEGLYARAPEVRRRLAR